MTQPRVFISYSHKDKLVAKYLAAHLQERGAEVWVDEGEILVGDSLLAKIAQGVQRASFVIAIISRNSIGSRWVRKELAIAMHKEVSGRRVVVLPVRVDDSGPPNFLKDKLYCDLSADAIDWNAELSRLFRSLGLTSGAHGTLAENTPLPLSLTIPAVFSQHRILESNCWGFGHFVADDVWTGGIYIPVRQRALGRVLAETPAPLSRSVPRRIKAPPTSRVLTLSAVSEYKPGAALRIRGLATCDTFARRRGFCAVCYGGDPMTGAFVRRATQVGRSAATSILTALERAQDISAVTRLFEAGPAPGRMVLSPADGVVRLERTATGTLRIAVTDDSGECFNVVTKDDPTVPEGDRVWLGQALTQGDPSPHDLLQMFGNKFVERHLVTELAAAFMRQGIRIPERDLELLVAVMTSYVKVEGGNEQDALVRRHKGKALPRRKFFSTNNRLLRLGREPILARPLVLGVSEIFHLERALVADLARNQRRWRLIPTRSPVVKGRKLT